MWVDGGSKLVWYLHTMCFFSFSHACCKKMLESGMLEMMPVVCWILGLDSSRARERRLTGAGEFMSSRGSEIWDFLMTFLFRPVVAAVLTGEFPLSLETCW